MREVEIVERRFFMDNNNINGDSCIIDGEEFNHIVNVLRLKAGETVILCTGDGNDRKAEIIEIGKRQLLCKIHEAVKNLNEAKIEVTLYMALVKGEKMELIAQKITELGAAELTPLYTRFTTVKPETARLNRLEKISLEAAKQCGRAKTLKINPVYGINEAAADFKSGKFDFVLFPYENEKERGLKAALKKMGKAKKIAVVIGSEGGFSQEEAEALEAAGAVPCSLGPRILRAETAAITAVAAVMLETGELS